MTKIRELPLPTARTAVDTTTGTILYIGTATVLIKFAGFTILTDPNFIHVHERISIGYGLHSTRLTNPAMDIEQIPPLDLILLSHFRADHFDQVARTKLHRAIPIVTTPHATQELRKFGFTQLEPLKTWESLSLLKGDLRLRITSMPGRHGPGIVSGLLPKVMGSILDFREADRHLARIYISGDTLMYDEIKEIPRRYPNIDIALLHQGGTRMFRIPVTMDGKQGAAMMEIIDPKVAIPIHYNDYKIFTSPLDDFRQEVEAAGLEDRVRYLRHGETFQFRAVERR